MIKLKAGQKVFLEDGSQVQIEECDFLQEAKDDVDNLIQSLIDTEWSKESDKGKALGLFKGLIFSDDPKAKKFMSALDKLTSSMKV